MKKKNGFTLIELLAVIVILAIIALIAVPQILKILDKARLNAAKDSTYGIIKAAETYATNFMLENNGTLPSEAIEFECDNTGCNLKTILIGYNLTGLNNLDFKGTKPTSGTIRISNNGRNIVAENLQINGFSCSYANDTATCISDGGSETPEPTTPVVTGPTSEIPTGEGYTNVLKIVYLDPTDLTNNCNSSNINSNTGITTGCMKWYAYSDDGTNYTMILDHNTTEIIDNWNNRNSQLATDINGWDSRLSPRLITADEIITITEYTGTLPYFFETLNSTIPSPYPTPSKYGWLYDRTSSSCKSYACLNNATGTSNNDMWGYWTDGFISSSSAIRVTGDGFMDVQPNNSRCGVRPVITVEKSLIS